MRHIIIIVVLSVLFSSCTIFGIQRGGLKIINLALDSSTARYIDVLVEIDNSDVTIFNDEDRKFDISGNNSFYPTLIWYGYGPKEISLICTIDSGAQKGASYKSRGININNDKVVEVAIYEDCLKYNDAPGVYISQ